MRGGRSMGGLAHQPCLRIPRLRSTKTAVCLISHGCKPWQHAASTTGGAPEGHASVRLQGRGASRACRPVFSQLEWRLGDGRIGSWIGTSA